MHAAKIYGFGTYFGNNGEAEDIDFLIVHSDYSTESCNLAINCKRRLSEVVSGAHITVLSEKEEQHFNFIKSSRATLIGTVSEMNFEGDFTIILH